MAALLKREIGRRQSRRQSNTKLIEISLNDPKSVDQYLASEILNLSIKDRNAIDEEIHGVSSCAPEESPEFLEASLKKLSEALENVSDFDPLKAAYIESQVLPETHVNTPGFRLKFLRSELFDAKKAAVRMMKFLNHTSDLFGPIVLQRPMHISDFAPEELEFMRQGVFQLLPFRDRRGRPIVVTGVVDMSRSNFVVTDRLRHKVYIYYLTRLADDVETQQKGMVMVYLEGVVLKFWSEFKCLATPNSKEARKYFEMNKLLAESTPLRKTATHFILPDTPYYHMLESVFLMMAGESSGKRMRFHYGEEVELLYKLKSYGIPVELMPTASNSRRQAKKTPYMQQWFNCRKYMEEHPEETSIILFPGSNDVLFRRGASLNSHPGNGNFRELIESNIMDHLSASQTEKTAINKSMIREIRQKGGRFLQYDLAKGWWVEIKDDIAIRKKVANQLKLFKFKPAAAGAQSVRSGTTLFQNQDNAKRRKVTNDDGSVSDASCGDACFL